VRSSLPTPYHHDPAMEATSCRKASLSLGLCGAFLFSSHCWFSVKMAFKILAISPRIVTEASSHEVLACVFGAISQLCDSYAIVHFLAVICIIGLL
jgi:hypothetical protein